MMIEDGLFDGLDAALMYHPCDRNHVASWPLASEDVEVVFHGLQAHASSDPWKGRNALDAMILLFTSVGLWRQQLRQTSRVHGIIREGGTAANIIPERTSAWFMIRSDDEAYYEIDARPVPGAVRGRRARDRHHGRGHVLGPRHDDAQQRGPRRALPGEHGRLRHRRPGRRRERRQHGHGQRQLGLPDDPPGPRDRATRARPATRSGFRDAAITPRADETTLLAAALVAQTAYELFADPELVAAAWARVPQHLTDCGQSRALGRCYHPRRAPRWTTGFEPAAPPARRSGSLSRHGRARLGRFRWPSARRAGPRRRPGRRRPHRHRRPPRRRGSRPATAGIGRSRSTTTSTCRPTSARSRS